MRRLAASAAVWALALPVLAAEGPSFDCARAESSAEELVCADAELAAMDRRLAEVYGQAVEVVQGLDAGADEALDTLKATQRGWIKGRDDCWKADDPRVCVELSYLIREVELTALWMLREPTAVTRWICEDNPANEVFVSFFDTPLPGLRAEYGDGIEAMHLSRSASGARYEGRFGRFFWEKGGEAMFSWQEGTEMRCEQEE